MYNKLPGKGTRLRSSMVEQATHNRQATGSNPVGARLFVVLSIIAFLSCQSMPLAVAQSSEIELKGPIPQQSSSPAPAAGTGAAAPPSSGMPTGGAAGAPTPAAAGERPSSAETTTLQGSGPAYPVIPPLQLISPPAVPPTLPPSYYDEKKLDQSTKSLPNAPALGPRLEPVPEPLKAGVVKSGISAAAGQLTGPLPSGRKLNVTVILLCVRNNTDRAIIVDGDQAIISATGAPLQALPENIVVKRTHPFFTKSQKIQLALITGLTLGLATVIAGERMTNKTSPSARFGVYETMRRIEDVRFGNRVVLPGEESKGLVFFDESVAPQGSVSIPIRAFPSNADSGRLSVEIAGSARLQ